MQNVTCQIGYPQLSGPRPLMRHSWTALPDIIDLYFLVGYILRSQLRGQCSSRHECAVDACRHRVHKDQILLPNPVGKNHIFLMREIKLNERRSENPSSHIDLKIH